MDIKKGFSNSLSDYEILHLNTYSSKGVRAYQSICNVNSLPCILKCISKQQLKPDCFTQMVQRLKEWKENFGNMLNLIQIYNIIEDKQTIYLVTEPGINLIQFVKQKAKNETIPAFSWITIQKFLKQICLLLLSLEGFLDEIKLDLCNFIVSESELSIYLDITETLIPSFFSFKQHPKTPILARFLLFLISGENDEKARFSVIDRIPIPISDLLMRLMQEDYADPRLILKHPFVFGPIYLNRLAPIHKSHRGMHFNITSDKKLRVDFISTNSYVEISANGQKIEFRSKKQNQIYKFSEIWSLFTNSDWKKYKYAFRFYDLVQSKTVKMTLYLEKANENVIQFRDKTATCCTLISILLMENHMIEIRFLRNKEYCKKNEREISVQFESSVLFLIRKYRLLFFQLESYIKKMSCLTNISLFPLVIGMRNKLIKEDFVPISNGSLKSFDLQSNPLEKIVRIEGIGIAKEVSLGVYRIDFDDNTSIVTTKSNAFYYKAADETLFRYDRKGLMPDVVKAKIIVIPRFLNQLVNNS